MMKKLLSLFVILMLFFQSGYLFVLGGEILEIDNSGIIENSPIFKESDFILERQNLGENLGDHKHGSENGSPDFFSGKNEVDEIIRPNESLTGEALSGQLSISEDNNENQSFKGETSPKLLITEVYFDGNNEWIEILNAGNEDFNGQLHLQSPEKSWDLNTSIGVGQLMIFAKNPSILSGISSQYLNINLTDTKAINLKLLFYEEEIDHFLVPESEVKKLDDKKTSFEKIKENGSFTIIPTTAARTKNMQTGYFGNPGQVFDFDDGDIEDQEPEVNNPSSGNEAKLVITETFFHTTNNWIEISNIGESAFSGELSLNGISQQGPPFSYTLQIPAQTSLVLAEKDAYFTGEFFKIITGDPYFLDWEKGLHLTLTYEN
ncbi:MAG: hypothetical protein DLD55_03545 [candidate division SR1 bacterium]|nr:MAG: hypothetical protein DLD55_03545 [candidate division SR1 bacterium]